MKADVEKRVCEADDELPIVPARSGLNQTVVNFSPRTDAEHVATEGCQSAPELYALLGGHDGMHACEAPATGSDMAFADVSLAGTLQRTLQVGAKWADIDMDASIVHESGIPASRNDEHELDGLAIGGGIFLQNLGHL